MFYLETKLKQIVHLFWNCQRGIHTQIARLSVPLSKENNKLKASNDKSKILNYFDSYLLKKECDNLNDDLFKKPIRLPYFLYLMNEEVGKLIFDSIKNDLKDAQYVLEANPGFGFITKHLLSLNRCKVKVFEPDPYFRKHMSKLKILYPNKLEVYSKNLYNNNYNNDFINLEDRITNINNVMKQFNWSDECLVKIIGSCPSDKYVRQLVMNIVFQKRIVEICRPQLFLVIDPKSYLLLNPKNMIIKPYPVLSKIFFHIDLILFLNKHNFLPWFNLKFPNYTKKYIPDLNNQVLVKITPKADLFERIGGPENLKSLWFFINHLCRRPNTRVISCIENWLPGYGYRLLMSGVDTFTVAGDLDPKKILDIFLEISKWPEFNNSTFFSALETCLEKGVKDNFEYEIAQEEAKISQEIDSDLT